MQLRLKGDLDNIVLRALRKEPERRYASPEQFAEDIRRHLDTYAVLGLLAQEQKHWSGAVSWYEKSLLAWRKIINPANLTTSGYTVRSSGEVAKRLEECKKHLLVGQS